MTTKNIESITVVGAGHLGHPLANQLTKEGHKVFGTNTSIAKADSHYENIILKLDNLENLPKSDLYIINIPPSKTSTQELRSLFELIKTKPIIFISSTSVFNNNQLLVSEDISPQPTSERSTRVYEQESIFRSNCIIRPSGLISETRHPINSLNKKEEVRGGNHPLNLIHINDLIEIIKEVIRRKEFVNLIHATHLNSYTKKEYYDLYSKKRNIDFVNFKDSKEAGKKVISNTLKEWSYIFKDDLL